MSTSSLALLLALGLGREAELPSLEDLWRFPRQSTCAAWVEYGRGHGQWANDLFLKTPCPQDQPILRYRNEVYLRTEAWALLEWAWREDAPSEDRREKLKRLLELIGPAAYAAGYLEPPLMLESFLMIEDFR